MKRVLLWILGIVVVLAAVAAVLLGRIDTQFVVNQIAEATAKATGRPLIFTSAPHLSLLPPGVKFEQARWGEITDGQGLAVSVKSGMAELELMPLFSGALVVREVRLDNPVLELREKTAAAPEKPRQDAGSTVGTKETKAAAPSDQLPVELVRLVVRQGEVIYVDARGASLHLKDLNLSMENLRRREEAGVQCDFDFDLVRDGKAVASSGNLAGTLALSAKLRYHAPDLTFRQVSLTVTPLGGLLPKEAGPAQLTCEGALDLRSRRLNLTKARLSTPQARLNLSGEGLLSPPAFKGNVDLEASPRKLAALAGQTLKPSSGEALTFKSALDFSADILHLRSMAARLDDIPLRGDLSLALGKPLSVSGGLQLGRINLDDYLPLPEQPGSASAAAAKKAGDASGRSVAGRTAGADDTPWPDVDLRVALTGVSRGKLSVNNLSFILKGGKGKYNAASLSCALGGGGTVKGVAGADLPGKAYSAKATASGVNLGALLDSLGQGRPVDGTASLEADLSVRGENAAAMLSSLNGRGTLEVYNLSLAAMSALPQNVPGLNGDARVPNRFDLVRAPFTARNGEITAQPITAASPGFNARGQARVSLPRQYLDATAEIKTLGMIVPVVAKGPFSGISYGVDPKFALDLAGKLPGALLDTGKNAGGAAQGAGGTLKERLRGAEGLMKGLFGK